MGVCEYYWDQCFQALMYFNGPVIFGGIVNLKIEAVRGQIFLGMGAGVRSCVLC